MARGRPASGALVLPLLHGGLRPVAGGHPSRHPHGLRARPDLPRLLRLQERSGQGRSINLVAARQHLPGRLGACDRSRRHLSLCPLDLQRACLPGRQSLDDRRGHGNDPHRRAARGDAPLRRLAAARHRHRRDALCLFRPLHAGHSPASRRVVVQHRQPPLPDEPGHLWHRSGSCCHLRLPLRALRRARDPGRARQAVHRSRHLRCRALCGRPGQGLDLRLGPVRHDLGLVHRQHGDGRLADHPGDDPRRLSAPFRGGRGIGGLDRRADHAADHGRRSLPDGRVPQRLLSDGDPGGDRAGLHALLRRVHAGPSRGQARRAEGASRRGDCPMPPRSSARGGRRSCRLPCC